jgi:O-methyltransferase
MPDDFTPPVIGREALRAAAKAERKAQRQHAKIEARTAHAVEKKQPRVKDPDRYAVLKQEYGRLRDEYEQVRTHYLVAGLRKNIDIREREPFATIARRVMGEERCGMDFDRLYTLWQAVEGAPPATPVIEIGTYMGGSAKFIAECLRAAGRSDRMYVCDTFHGHAHLHPEFDPPETKPGFQNTSAEDVRRYLAAYPNVETVEGDILTTAQRFVDIDNWGFVHLDVDVYVPSDFALKFFAPRLAPGAWIVVDDYGSRTCPGAAKAVDDFNETHPEFRVLLLLTGQAVIHRVG